MFLAVPSVFGCIPPGSRYGNVPNELVHGAGPPFLDNHYRGYQYPILCTDKWFFVCSLFVYQEKNSIHAFRRHDCISM